MRNRERALEAVSIVRTDACTDIVLIGHSGGGCTGSASATTVWFPGLTSREQEIAGCLVANLRDKETSECLGMAHGTVHVHLVSLYKKLGVHSRRHAVAKLLGGAKSNPF